MDVRKVIHLRHSEWEYGHFKILWLPTVCDNLQTSTNISEEPAGTNTEGGRTGSTAINVKKLGPYLSIFQGKVKWRNLALRQPKGNVRKSKRNKIRNSSNLKAFYDGRKIN
jgi:hypothetical protein